MTNRHHRSSKRRRATRRINFNAYPPLDHNYDVRIIKLVRANIGVQLRHVHAIARAARTMARSFNRIASVALAADLERDAAAERVAVHVQPADHRVSIDGEI